MIKKSILLLAVTCTLSNQIIAQQCGTDEMLLEHKKIYPKTQQIEDALNMQLRGAMLKTTSSSLIYDKYMDSVYQAVTATKVYIPVVVHVIHDYGAEYVSDNEIETMIANMNKVYLKQNADTNAVIAPFKPYIGKANMEFRLARKDPQGNPTNGITRRQTPLTDGGDEQAKLDQWAPDRYFNIWIEKRIGKSITTGTILAYATIPSSGASNPFSDGVIAASPYINTNTKTVEHEAGHYFNLYHPWNSSQQQAGVACGDDEVDDTPPTKGHFSTCPLYDTACATGYTKKYIYDSLGTLTSAVVDYPDTTNTQNIMDYSNCVVMFTKQQVIRMRETLRNTVANRNNLIAASNLAVTGIDDPNYNPNGADIVTADFSVEKPSVTRERTYFLCGDGNKSFLFKNQSWNGTITGVNLEVSNNSAVTNGTSLTSVMTAKVSQPGWVTVKLTASSATTSNSVEKMVYAADPNDVIDPMSGYAQEFNPGSDVDKWPTFNYYNNANKWQVVNNTGYYDNTSIMYTGYDKRTYPTILVGSPRGDYDDFFTRAFNLSGMTSGECNLSFMYSGAFRTSDANLMRDTLQISYSTDCGDTWKELKKLMKNDIANKGSYSAPYAPLYYGDWALQTISIPGAARTDKVFFRFRYKPGVDDKQTVNGYETGTGNNFYIDRINVNPYTAGVNTLLDDAQTFALAPNPTTGNAYLIIKGYANTNAQVQVTDITGKVVFNTQQNLVDKVNRIEIPASAIAVKGMYLVHVTCGAQQHTEKLVTY